MNYWYKDSEGLFHVKSDVYTANEYILKIYKNETVVALEETDTNKIVFGPIEITYIIKENDDPYTDLADLLAGIGDMFKAVAKILVTMDMSTPSTAGINLTFASGNLNIDWKEGGGLVPFVSGVELTHTYSTPDTYIAQISGDLENITKFIADNSKITFIKNLTTGLLTDFKINDNLYSGVLDMNNAPTKDIFITNNNTDLSEIIHASSGNEVISNYQINSCGIVGIHNVSNVPLAGAILMYSNPLMTGVDFAVVGNGIATSIRVYGCNITGVFDLTNLRVSTHVYLHSNPLLTGVDFATTGNSKLANLYIHSCNLTGVLDLSNVPISKTLHLYSNPLFTNILFSETGNTFLDWVNIQDCNFTGTLDFSNIPFGGANSQLYIYNNSLLDNILFASSGNALLKNVRLYSCILNYINLASEGMTLAFDASRIQLQNNSMNVSDVNHILVDLYSLVSGEGGGGDYTGRTITINGTNAAPDGSSGGFDGDQAVIDLTAKGITVTTS